MTLIDVIIQGIIQGITEFLPISSSGHLSVYQYFFGLNTQDSMLFSVVLHLGTLAAVFIAFWDTLREMFKEVFLIIVDIVKKKNIFREQNEYRRMIFMVFIACIPLIGAYFLGDLVAGIATDNDIIVEGICFLISGFLLHFAFFKERGDKEITDMRAFDAFVIGSVQMIAVFPGISRSGSTVSIGVLKNFKKEFAISFSFILGIPAIIGAAVSEFTDISVGEMSVSAPMLIIGFLTSAIIGILTISLIRWLIKKDVYVMFAYYLFLIGSAAVAFGVLKRLT